MRFTQPCVSFVEISASIAMAMRFNLTRYRNFGIKIEQSTKLFDFLFTAVKMKGKKFFLFDWHNTIDIEGRSNSTVWTFTFLGFVEARHVGFMQSINGLLCELIHIRIDFATQIFFTFQQLMLAPKKVAPAEIYSTYWRENCLLAKLFILVWFYARQKLPIEKASNPASSAYIYLAFWMNQRDESSIFYKCMKF